MASSVIQNLAERIVQKIFGNNADKVKFLKLSYNDGTATSVNSVLQDVVNNIGTLEHETFVFGLHYYAGWRGFIALVYPTKLYGGCITFSFGYGDFAAYILSNGEYERRQIQTVSS